MTSILLVSQRKKTDRCFEQEDISRITRLIGGLFALI